LLKSQGLTLEKGALEKMIRTYTQDWFDRCIPSWTKYLDKYKGKENLRFLEVGSYEGRSTCWLLDNILTHLSSKIKCFDLFEGCSSQGEWSKELYDRYNMSEVFRNFISNVSSYGDRVEYRVGVSQELLRELGHSPLFDFIYIDGSHIACDVLEDSVLAFRLLKPNGIMILDDYTWEFFEEPLRHPKMGIDAFLTIFHGQFDVLLKDRQVILRKTGIKEE